jgi:protein-disulfide isomerase
MEEKKKEGMNLAVPGAIMFAGILIAGALVFSSLQSSEGQQVAEEAPQDAGSLDAMDPVSEKDHIRGNPNAPVMIVEYSDYECPFCKRFHETMNQVMDTYGAEGKVAWVYRHFPLDQIHPVKARQEAATAECVAELGGDDMFWKFSDRFFELTPSNNQTDLTLVLPQIISELGLSQTKVDECVASGRYDDHIQNDLDNAIATGGRGTPWSILIAADGTKYPLSGAQPLSAINQLIELGLGNN